MTGLELRYEACVRTRSRAATCTACVATCPVDAIAIGSDGGALTVDLGRCTECGICQATCPTEAFRAPFDVAGFLAQAGSTVTCGDGLPCAAALAAEDLVTLATRHRELRVVPHLKCASARSHSLVESRVEQANALFMAAGMDAVVRLPVAFARTAHAAPPPPPARGHARREFLRRFIPGVAAVAPPVKIELDPTRLDVKALRTPSVPARRTRLLAVLAPAPSADSVPTADIGFSSSKALDTSSCTACMLCVNVCPTGALATSPLRDALHFDASCCVKCSSCHDVCEPRSLGLARTFDVPHFLSRARRPIGRFTVQACGECGSLFKSDSGAVVCSRCEELDDEARALLRRS